MNLRFTFCLTILGMIGLASKSVAQCNQGFCQTPEPFFAPPLACILPSEHSLDCYFGETTDNVPIGLPPYWCTSVENNQWFAFMANSPYVEFNISVSQCNFGGALQAALLETWDCINFSFVSDCYGNIPDGTTQAIVNNIPLTPGNVYFLMIDGSAGAKCSFSINGSSGITSGPTNVCIPGGPFTYTAIEQTAWTIQPPNMGDIIGSDIGASVQVNWNQPGTAQICAQSIACANLATFCLNVNIGESATAEHTFYQCPGETILCSGQTFTNPGTYTFNVPSPSGCDSIVTCIINAVSPTTTDLGDITLPCDGLFTACGEEFSSLGTYQTICTGWLGCDSTVIFNLVQGDVLADAGPDVFFTCHGPYLANLDGAASSQGSNFSYQWTTSNGHIISGSDGLMPTVDMPGEYCLTATNQSTGCQMTDCVTVSKAVELAIDGSAVFCPGPGDVNYQLHVFTNTAGTLFFQVNGGATQMAGLGPGTSTVPFDVQLDNTSLLSAWLVNVNGCNSDTVTLLVNEDNAHIEFSLTQTVCNSASLTADLVGNFQNTANAYHWSTGSSTQSITILQDGWYHLTITDNYGCPVVDSVFATIDFTGNCAYLQGTVRYDVQMACQLSADDTLVEGFIVEAINTSTNQSYFGTTDMDGKYFIPVPPGIYTISVLLPPGNGYVACVNAFISPDIAIGSPFTQDFLIFQQPTCPYMTVDIGVNLLRRCMNNAYYINYCNNGSAVAYDASIVVTLDPALTLLQSALPNIPLGNNQYSFSLGDVQPGACGSFQLLTFLDCGVPLGQIHCVQANIYPNTLCQGYGPSDFMDEDCHPNIGSYDPNAKTASPAGVGSEHFIEAGTELTYQIRFQNTGTDTAYNVVIRDTLADKFEYASLEPGASSHPYSFEFYGQRILKLTLNNIKLPPVGVNEPASIGFVQFKIRLKDDLPPHDLVENQASVYFDNNLPVATNTYAHTIGSPDSETYQSVDICQGETYDFNGELLTQTGNYTTTLSSSLGGDSIVHLSLTVHPKAITELSAQICEGESVVFNGDTLTETGDVKLTLQTIYGCDSIVNFSLDVWPQYELFETAVICTGSTYFFNGQTLDQSGEYMAHFNSVNGCDSTIILNLEIVDIIETTTNASICNGESYWFNNEQLTQSGTYIGSYASVGGCDSIVTLHLTVLPPPTGTQALAICEGETVLINGMPFGAGDTLEYVIVAGSVNGCDSIVTLIGVGLPTAHTALEQTICEGEFYEFNGVVLIVAGEYEAVYSAANGCDSIVTLTLLVEPTSPVTNISLEVLQGYNYNGTVITQDTVLAEQLLNIHGCDSTIITSFTVLPNSTQSVLAQLQFHVLPNPTNGAFQVHFNLPYSSVGSLHLLDMVGREMPQPYLIPVNYTSGEHILHLDASYLPSGVYLVQLKTAIGAITEKLVVE